jgi:hypothetical protein
VFGLLAQKLLSNFWLSIVAGFLLLTFIKKENSYHLPLVEAKKKGKNKHALILL